jgi:hypothetical protein
MQARPSRSDTAFLRVRQESHQGSGRVDLWTVLHGTDDQMFVTAVNACMCRGTIRSDNITDMQIVTADIVTGC